MSAKSLVLVIDASVRRRPAPEPDRCNGCRCLGCRGSGVPFPSPAWLARIKSATSRVSWTLKLFHWADPSWWPCTSARACTRPPRSPSTRHPCDEPAGRQQPHSIRIRRATSAMISCRRMDLLHCRSDSIRIRIGSSSSSPRWGSGAAPPPPACRLSVAPSGIWRWGGREGGRAAWLHSSFSPLDGPLFSFPPFSHPPVTLPARVQTQCTSLPVVLRPSCSLVLYRSSVSPSSPLFLLPAPMLTPSLPFLPSLPVPLPTPLPRMLPVPMLAPDLT